MLDIINSNIRTTIAINGLVLRDFVIDKNDRLSVHHKNYLIFRTNNILQSIFLKRKLSKKIYRNLFQALYRSRRLLRKRRWHLRFLVNFAKFLKTPFLTEHLRCCFCLYQVSCLDASSFRPWWKNIFPILTRVAQWRLFRTWMFFKL